MCFSNDKQLQHVYSNAYCATFVMPYCRMTLLNIDVELLETYQTIEECIRFNGKEHNLTCR